MYMMRKGQKTDFSENVNVQICAVRRLRVKYQPQLQIDIERVIIHLSDRTFSFFLSL